MTVMIDWLLIVTAIAIIKIVRIIIKFWYLILSEYFCQYLSMHFLSKVLTSPKVAFILFQAILQGRDMWKKQTFLHTRTATDQNFVIVCRYFLKKCRLYQTTSMSQFYYSLLVFFLLLSLCFLWYFSYMSLVL